MSAGVGPAPRHGRKGCHAGLDPASGDGARMAREPGLRIQPAMTARAASPFKAAMTAIAGALLSVSAFAQMNPVGLWRTIDDKTGEPRAEIRISESGGAVSGRIERRLGPEVRPGEVCDRCRDERKGQPLDGLEILRQARKVPGEDVWDGGKILDPENGREYTLRLTPIDGGRRLDVRGSIGPFGRTQTWVRVQ